MEQDSSDYRASYRRLATLAVVLSLALVPLSGLGAAQQTGNQTAASNQSFVAIQGDECTPISSFSDNESAVEYYDYRLPEEFSDNPYANATGNAFGSEGTIDLQEPNGSVVFLYTDTTDNSTYLVFVNGQEANDNSTGGAATFEITGLPEDGNWTVRDDDYDDPTSVDNWNVTNTTTTVDWIWSDAATDGGVYSGIDNDTNVTVDPAFNEEAELFGQNGNGTVESWQVLSNESDNVTRTDLELNESLQIAGGTCEDPADGEAVTDGNETNETASVTFDDQESDGTTVTVQNVTVPEDGYVAIHNDSLLDGDAVGSVVGVSEYLEAGEYDNLTVELFDVPGAEFNESELTENQTLIAMPHEETSGNETYDFVTSNGTEDGPFTDDGEAVTDDANVTVVNETNETVTDDTNETPSVTFDDQESDGTTVTVQNVAVPEDGYVAIHSDSLLDGETVGSVIGVSEYLEAGEYEDLTVELFDVPGADFGESELTENQTLTAMLHEESDGDETFDYVSAAGFVDQPFLDNGDAVTDNASIEITDTTETETPTENETTETETPTENETTETETPTENETTETETPTENDS